MTNKTLQKSLDADKKISRHYKVFIITLKTKVTKRGYVYNLDAVMRYLKLKKYSQLVDMDENVRQDKLEEFLMDNQDKSKSFGQNHVAAVGKFLSMNRCNFWKVPLQSLTPKGKMKKGNQLPYTLDDAKSMLSVTSNLRTVWIIHFFNSTGARPGGTDDEDGYLQVKHIKEMPDGCATIRVYDDTDEAYDGFLTPEAYDAWKAYRNFREDQGEVITPESPVFARVNLKGPIRAAAVTRILGYVVGKSVKRVKMNSKKYDKGLTYGFRKRLNTILKLDSDVNSNIAEKIIAHRNGLDGIYFVPTVEECFAEFRKAIPEITISQEEKLRVENLKLRDKVQHHSKADVMKVFEMMNISIDDLKELAEKRQRDRKFK